MEITIPELKEISEKLDKIMLLLEGQRINTDQENAYKDEKRFLRVKDVATYLGVSKSTVYRLTSEKKIPHKKICSTLVFSKEEIDEWIQ